MSTMSGDSGKCQVYIYLDEKFIDLPLDEEDTCEDLCTELCKRYNIGPVVQLLVGLRIHEERWFLAPCAKPQPGKKYEFRVRFKIPKLSNLKKLNHGLFNYYYYQLRHDLLQSKIPEMEYDEYKNKILGYVVNDMYRKMVESNVSVSELKRTYEDYMPRKINKEHTLLIFNWARSKVFNSLNKICHVTHDADYVKSVYINDIDNIAPGYLYEEYNGSIPYPREDGLLKPGKCRVKIRFVPYVSRSSTKRDKASSKTAAIQKDELELPGLKVFYSQEWRHIANIDEIFTILVENLTVNISLKDQPNLYSIDFNSQTELDSFVTCLCGYYRLMCKWTVYLCKPYLWSPSLNRLTELKCHGPIGGQFSYNKLKEKNSSIGANIVRQCETNYDTYFVDILEQTCFKTYKLTYSDHRWHVYGDGDQVSVYDELVDVLRNLNPEIQHLYRLSPTEHDKAPALLLCSTQSDMVTKPALHDVNEMRSAGPQIINPLTDLAISRNKLKGDDYFDRARAELRVKPNSSVKVMILSLKNNRSALLSEFLQLASFWASIDSVDIIKLYGVTLSKPVSMVLESSLEDPLDVFLRKRKHVSLASLIEVGHSLTRALYYLQENKFVHGRIRCSSMFVTKYDRNEGTLVAKLGDPGLVHQYIYTEQDLLWIPIEYHKLTPRDVQLMKTDLKTDAWACSTALWEIFSRGKRANIRNPKQFIQDGLRLKVPTELEDIRELYECMWNGWLVDPDKRISPQIMISKLVQARQKINYCEIGPSRLNGTARSANGSCSQRSILSIETDSTFLHSRTDVSGSSYVSNGSDLDGASNASSECSSQPLISNGGSSQYSGGSDDGMNQDQANAFFYDCPDYIELPDGAKIIFQGEIGQGYYGRVFKGCIDYGNDTAMRKVALKTIHNNASNMMQTILDFKREVAIMQKLNHENIVQFNKFIDERDKLVVVMEYMENGSLLDFLGYNRHRLTKQDLLRFAKDIANGMHHLFEMKIIHRDLAARNILVQSIDCVKISDFGLAQVTDSDNYYRERTNRVLPVRWYAPETLENFKYSHQSDVWSYGVTLYEMFTYGENPYSDVDITSRVQMFRVLESGTRLELQGEPNRDVQEQMMVPCFHWQAKQRPSFEQLLHIIEVLINQEGELIRPL
ncbi:tyrosine-protein kinase hopscotch [Uranotaenia lowii]|uniref:tyrosine-protein kinase hopscotch n=1 Tax=Uranotaenia lowii TaxID=190385 RepID=UPI00247AFF3C|nr:tyrosine-protein kinase hopscotch [Uranotaenia lowii]